MKVLFSQNRCRIFSKYFRAYTGTNDTYHEVLRDYPATMGLTPKNKAIVEENCLRCHQSTVENTGMAAGGQECTKCHRGLIHGINKSKEGIAVE